MISPRIAVLGLGNLMRTDDAVGMLAAQQLRTQPRLPPGVLVIEGGTLGLELLHPLEDVTHLLAVDAVEAGLEPGALLHFSGDELADLPVSKSVHLLGFSDLIGALRLTGPGPSQITVIGVQPKSTGWGTELTAPVQAALPRVLEAAINQVEQWTEELAPEPWAARPAQPLPETAAE